MKTAAKMLLLGVVLSCSKKSTEADALIWKAPLIQCTKSLCGGVVANVSAHRLESGEVTVASNGQVTVTLRGIKDKSGAVVSGKEFEVHFGAFAPNGYIGLAENPIGTVKTDSEGNYAGVIQKADGTPFAFMRDRPWSGQFIFNDPGVRSEFVTGFQIR